MIWFLTNMVNFREVSILYFTFFEPPLRLVQ